MRLTTAANDALDEFRGSNLALPQTLHAMTDAMLGQPAGHSFDVVGSVRSVLWCWEHEREVRDCQHANPPRNCTGETILANDPTGEAAVEYDKARADRAELDRVISEIRRAVGRYANLIAPWKDRALTIDRNGVGYCTDCNRYFDGTRTNRLTAYKGGDLVCMSCRTRRDRLAS